MVKLRLQRFGTKNKPVYRLVATDSRAPRDGRFIEILGQYNSTSLRDDVNLKDERVRYWLGKGAQPTDTVRGILRRKGLLATAAN